jgi:hypothetical protein
VVRCRAIANGAVGSAEAEAWLGGNGTSLPRRSTGCPAGAPHGFAREDPAPGQKQRPATGSRHAGQRASGTPKTDTPPPAGAATTGRTNGAGPAVPALHLAGPRAAVRPGKGAHGWIPGPPAASTRLAFVDDGVSISLSEPAVDRPGIDGLLNSSRMATIAAPITPRFHTRKPLQVRQLTTPGRKRT